MIKLESKYFYLSLLVKKKMDYNLKVSLVLSFFLILNKYIYIYFYNNE